MTTIPEYGPPDAEAIAFPTDARMKEKEYGAKMKAEGKEIVEKVRRKHVEPGTDDLGEDTSPRSFL